MDRYSKIEIVSSSLGIKYYKNTIYPDIPLSENDIYVITDIGDRLDILARDYYKDDTLYWILLSANPTLEQFSLYPTPGTQMRIPQEIDTIISNFNRINGL